MLNISLTRTTRTPACWDTPAAPWLPLLVIHIRSQVKRRQSQNYKFKKIAKNSNFEILQETLHKSHLLKLLDKMYKYEMNPTRTVGATERTQLRCAGGIITDSGHNGHKPKRPKPKRPQTETATNRNGHRPKRPQTETATNRNGHRPERPQTETATDRNGHKQERLQTETATNRNGHK